MDTCRNCHTAYGGLLRQKSVMWKISDVMTETCNGSNRKCHFVLLCVLWAPASGPGKPHSLSVCEYLLNQHRHKTQPKPVCVCVSLLRLTCVWVGVSALERVCVCVPWLQYSTQNAPHLHSSASNQDRGDQPYKRRQRWWIAKHTHTHHHHNCVCECVFCFSVPARWRRSRDLGH